ncbi:unnamed protein product [Vitrella brassicaformis CCMP3155]|uniref:Uncharacterized protein n=1 Tax=Vitrella brassicaformis (strain CCMP3155) TaxID=1169540 RepID=A0A0G4GFK9_VITBC|nr:unnamed protein product [Vitrella brassicaformis CCMP3155]|eukprot:CEM28085.1 unnamed protein product [Vitrella brassicaformis CCMP3155]
MDRQELLRNALILHERGQRLKKEELPSENNNHPAEAVRVRTPTPHTCTDAHIQTKSGQDVPAPPPHKRGPPPKRIADFPPDEQGKPKRHRIAVKDFLEGDAGAPSSNSSEAGAADDERQVVLNDCSVGISFPADTNDVSERLVCRILRRNITGRGVSRLIDKGADAVLKVGLPGVKVPSNRPWWAKKVNHGTSPELRLLQLAIDDPTGGCPGLKGHMSSTKEAAVQLVLPLWPSRERQREVLEALIAGGAPIDKKSITTAFQKANHTALDTFLSHRHLADDQALFFIDEDHRPCPPKDVYEQYFDALLPCIRRLLEHDSSLATEELHNEYLPIHSVAKHASFTKNFTIGFCELLYEFGSPLNSKEDSDYDGYGMRPIDQAKGADEPWLLEFLCKRLPASVLVRRGPELMRCFSGDAECAQRHARKEATQALEKRYKRRAEAAKEKIRLLLRAGVALPLPAAHIATTRKGDPALKAANRERQVIKREYVGVLNRIRHDVMNTVNAALRPQRDFAALLTHLLPLAPHNDGPPDDPVPSILHFGPEEAAAIAWHIAALCFDIDTAHQTVSDIQLRSHSRLGHRIHTAMDHFVASAVFHASGNTAVVGGRHEEDGQVVHAPPLQCFAIRGEEGGQPRVLGLREVVHKARLDEATEHCLRGVVKGFHEHLGDADCHFEWDGLGFVDDAGEFVSMADCFAVPEIEGGIEDEGERG